MPELPEVETIRRGVAAHLIGRELVAVRRPSLRAARRDADPAALARLAGREVTEVARRGKLLWIALAGADEAIVVHLGMSGQLLVASDGATPAPRHLAATLTLDGGDELRFVDQRTFGYLHVSPLVPTADGAPGGTGSEREVVPAVAAHVGRDPLDPHLDLEAAAARMARTSSAVKRVLLDQRYVSGIGNIYADETLFAARVHPEAPARDLGEETLAAVVRTAGDVMGRAVEVGGTSFDRLYVNTAGESGYFARELLAYGRAGEPCVRCGTPLERIVVGGRSSHLCPVCQRDEPVR